MIDFKAISQVSHPCSAFVGVGDDDYFVTAIDQFGGKLIYVTFNAAGLGEKEIADL